VSLIEVAGLRKVFRTRRGPVEAVAGIDFRVEPGELVGVDVDLGRAAVLRAGNETLEHVFSVATAEVAQQLGDRNVVGDPSREDLLACWELRAARLRA
jgi:hypothetical protein